MKILLIRPTPWKSLFGAESFLPLGIAYIASSLEAAGHNVKVIDFTVQPYNDTELISLIKKENPDVVGFSAVTPTVKSAYRTAKIVKENIHAKTVIGGPHPTAMPEEPLSNNIDFVVRGEGEFTIVDLCNHMNNPAIVKGISYVKDKNIVHNPDRAYIKDLDSLPSPARHLFPPLKLYKGQPALGNRLPVGNIMTSRGCPFNCTFCYKAVFGRHFRARSPENVMQEWEELIKKYKVKEIAIVDDTFTTNVDRVFEICELILKRNLEIPWSCPNGIRVDTVSYELLKKMNEAGCYRIALGIESGSQKILDTIGKKISIRQIEDAVSIAKKSNIETTAFMMLGNLEETEETMEETIRFSKKIEPTYVQFVIAVPYPGSYLYEEVKRNGKIFINDWDEYGPYEGKLCFEYKHINKELIDRMYKKAYKEYYLRVNYILKQLFSLKTYTFFTRRLKAFVHFIK
ncbi:MAG: B12-binding domain-containing radical SAM protein [Nitrospirae bacterium]|nr:B12-binding domain-containing radical SAM protein [Nitrospirota bacterium]